MDNFWDSEYCHNISIINDHINLMIHFQSLNSNNLRIINNRGYTRISNPLTIKNLDTLTEIQNKIRPCMEIYKQNLIIINEIDILSCNVFKLNLEKKALDENYYDKLMTEQGPEKTKLAKNIISKIELHSKLVDEIHQLYDIYSLSPSTQEYIYQSVMDRKILEKYTMLEKTLSECYEYHLHDELVQKHNMITNHVNTLVIMIRNKKTKMENYKVYLEKIESKRTKEKKYIIHKDLVKLCKRNYELTLQHKIIIMQCISPISENKLLVNENIIKSDPKFFSLVQIKHMRRKAFKLFKKLKNNKMIDKKIYDKYILSLKNKKIIINNNIFMINNIKDILEYNSSGELLDYIIANIRITKSELYELLDTSYNYKTPFEVISYHELTLDAILREINNRPV